MGTLQYIDASGLPLVLVTAPAEIDMGWVDTFIGGYEPLLRRGEPFVTVTDVTRVCSRPPPTVRKALAEWSREVEPLLVKCSKGDARVVQSAIIRGAMTAVGWVHQHPVPQQWFGTLGEAVTWALARLDAERVAVPAQVRARFERRAAP